MSDETPESDPHDELHHSVLAWLRNTRAAALYYINREGKRCRISLRSGKGRWEIAARMIMRMLDDVDRLEAEDARGALVDTWRVPPPVEAEQQAEAAAAKEREDDERAQPRELRATFALAKFIEESNRRAVTEYAKGQRELLGYVMAVNKATTQRLEVLERSFSNNLETVFEAYKTRAQIEGFIAGGGLKNQQQQEHDPNERMVMYMLAQKMGVKLPAGFLGTGDEPQPATVVEGNSPTDPF